MVSGMTCLAAITRMAAGWNWDLIQALLDWLSLDGQIDWADSLSVGFCPINRSKNRAHRRAIDNSISVAASATSFAMVRALLWPLN
jgi:hypothetical protein